MNNVNKEKPKKNLIQEMNEKWVNRVRKPRSNKHTIGYVWNISPRKKENE